MSIVSLGRPPFHAVRRINQRPNAFFHGPDFIIDNSLVLTY